MRSALAADPSPVSLTSRVNGGETWSFPTGTFIHILWQTAAELRLQIGLECQTGCRMAATLVLADTVLLHLHSFSLKVLSAAQPRSTQRWPLHGALWGENGLDHRESRK